MEAAHAHQMKRRLPSDLQHIIAIAKLEFIRNIRRKRLLIFFIIIAIVTVLILTILPAFGGYPNDPLLGPYNLAQFFTSFVNFLAVLLAVFYGGDALVSEFHSKTGYFIFPNPVSKLSLFIGKLFATLLASVLVLGVYYLVIMVSLGAIYLRVPAELLYSFLLAIPYTTACIGVAFLISSLMRTTTSATVLTFVLFLFIFQIISGVLMFVEVRADYLLTFQSGVINGVVAGPYPELFPKDQRFNEGGVTFTLFQPTVAMAVFVSTLWAVVCLVCAYLFFRIREMSG